MDLAHIAFAVLAFAVLMYVALDGYDLGVGILFPFVKGEQERTLMLATIEPIWDANETWIVLNGGLLYGAFPLAYGILFNAWYIPVMIMLFGIIFRGISIEFHGRAAHKGRWSAAFTVASYVITFIQGSLVGSFIEGIAVHGDVFAGSVFDWMTPFSAFCGVALMGGYALLGATWTIFKVTGDLQVWCTKVAFRLIFLVSLLITAVTIWTGFVSAYIRRRWIDEGILTWLSPDIAIAVILTLLLMRALRRGRETLPYVYSVLLFACSYIAMVASIWPYIIPWHYTHDAVAAAPYSISFLLIGSAISLPLILIYTSYTHWIFRHKVDPDHPSGY